MLRKFFNKGTAASAPASKSAQLAQQLSNLVNGPSFLTANTKSTKLTPQQEKWVDSVNYGQSDQSFLPKQP